MEINPVYRVPITSVDPVITHTQGADMTDSIVAAVRTLNESEMMGTNRELLFARDSETHRPVIQIRDRSTGEVLNQIPPKQVLRIMADLVKQRKQESNF